MRDLLVVLAALVSAAVGCALADEAKQQDGGWAQPKLPAVKWGDNWYPEAAMRSGLQGRVLVAFDITPAGVAKNVSILWAENEAFSQSARQMLAGAHFAVPDDWSARGAWRRWRLGIVYRLTANPPLQSQPDEFAIPAEKVYVTGSITPIGYKSPVAYKSP